MKTILLIHGPNLNLLGDREPEIYGNLTLDDLVRRVEVRAHTSHVHILPFQSNHEGDLIDFLHQYRYEADGILINPGALTHYSYALRDALSAIDLPTVEIHLSDIENREPFRKHSVIRDVCITAVWGHGVEGYLQALDMLLTHLGGEKGS